MISNNYCQPLIINHTIITNLIILSLTINHEQQLSSTTSGITSRPPGFQAPQLREAGFHLKDMMMAGMARRFRASVYFRVVLNDAEMLFHDA